MPPDLPNEQEIMLKKRARRRLVGAIALVLLMVIVLPQVLQDRAVLTQQEAIKITMPDVVSNNSEPVADKNPAELEVNQQSPQSDAATDEIHQAEAAASPKSSIEDSVANKETENKKPDATPEKVQVERKVTEKAPESSVVPKTGAAQKQGETFAVQVGVYSDLANVKRLQDQLKQAGFSTYTEKINTPKGESIRLKAGNFTSRQDAVAALGKLKEIGLPGIVVSNE